MTFKIKKDKVFFWLCVYFDTACLLLLHQQQCVSVLTWIALVLNEQKHVHERPL